MILTINECANRLENSASDVPLHNNAKNYRPLSTVCCKQSLKSYIQIQSCQQFAFSAPVVLEIRQFHSLSTAICRWYQPPTVCK